MQRLERNEIESELVPTESAAIATAAADLVLVEGDPSQRIGVLRQTRTVMLGGKLLDADALRSAAGFSGRPK